MAKVTIVRHWPDGDKLHVSVQEDGGHPDGLLGEVARIACDAYAETLSASIALDAMDEEPDGL